MTFDAYDVVVVPFPFVDREVSKRRPALVLSNAGFHADHDQLVLAMITSARASRWRSDVELRAWADAGLIAPCKVRLKVFTLQQDRIVRRLGRLTANDRQAVRAMLSASLAI